MKKRDRDQTLLHCQFINIEWSTLFWESENAKMRKMERVHLTSERGSSERRASNTSKKCNKLSWLLIMRFLIRGSMNLWSFARDNALGRPLIIKECRSEWEELTFQFPVVNEQWIVGLSRRVTRHLTVAGTTVGTLLVQDIVTTVWRMRHYEHWVNTSSKRLYHASNLYISVLKKVDFHRLLSDWMSNHQIWFNVKVLYFLKGNDTRLLLFKR